MIRSEAEAVASLQISVSILVSTRKRPGVDMQSFDERFYPRLRKGSSFWVKLSDLGCGRFPPAFLDVAVFTELRGAGEVHRKDDLHAYSA